MRGIKWAALVLVLVGLIGLAGCSLALPEEVGTGETFAGYWITYGVWDDARTFDPEAEDTQCLVTYRTGEGEDAERTLSVGKAFSEVHQTVNVSDAGEEYSLSATLYLIEDDVAAETSDLEIWLEGDVVESLRMTLEEDGYGCGNVTTYLSQKELDAHGAELEAVAAEYGCKLTFATESPRKLRFHAVYRRADGSLYADDFSHFINVPLDGSGFSGSVTNSETVNGKIQADTVSVSVTVKAVPALSSARIIEMNAENEPLRISALTQADGTYETGDDCAYAIVEETYADASVARFAYSRNRAGETHTFRYPRADGMTDAVPLDIGFE